MFNGRKTLQPERAAEPTVYDILARRGYFPERQKLLGSGIYGARLVSDIFVSDAPAFKQGLAIETRWQRSEGIDDERLPYLVENIRQHYPCPAIVIIETSPAREGAIRWLKAQSAEVERLLAVLSFAEFVRWCGSNLG